MPPPTVSMGETAPSCSLSRLLSCMQSVGYSVSGWNGEQQSNPSPHILGEVCRWGNERRLCKMEIENDEKIGRRAFLISGAAAISSSSALSHRRLIGASDRISLR